MTDGFSPVWLLLGAAAAATVSSAAAISNPAAHGLAWQLLGCAAGAITSLAVRPYAGLNSWRSKALAFFTAFAFAFFVTPWLFGKPTYTREEGGIYYGMALGSFVLIPVLLQRLKAMVNALLGVAGKAAGADE